MAIFLFLLVLFLSDVRPVASALHSPGRVTADTVTSARASSDSLDMTAVYPVCASITKPTRAYATRGTSCCHLTDSMCVRPSLLSVSISSALP